MDQVFGVGWYRREQWPLLKAEAADSAALEDTYEEWLQAVQKIVVDLTNAGVTAKRVEVDVNELVAWCRMRGCPVDGAARAEFVTQKLKDEHEQSSNEIA